MTLFSDIATDHAVADAAFALAEQAAFQHDDDAAFDRADRARRRNDQAYFLYLFTRLEDAINEAVATLLLGRRAASVGWDDRRVWQAWSRMPVRDIALMSKAEVLLDKGRQDYATIKGYYDGRNTIAHGGFWDEQFFVPNVAMEMDAIVQRFSTT